MLWSSRLIVQRSRASARLRGSSFGARWVFVPNSIASNTDDDDDTNCRRFSTGRRHGWKGDSEKKPKTNFAEEFLKPAARGELKENHSSGIPKLAVRKHKGHKLQGDVEGLDDDWGIPVPDFEEGNLVETMNQDISRREKGGSDDAGAGAGGDFGGGGSKSLSLSPDPDDRPDGVYSLGFDNGRDPEYWREEDFDVVTAYARAMFRNEYLNGDAPLSGLSKERLDDIFKSDFDWEVTEPEKGDDNEEEEQKKGANDSKKEDIGGGEDAASEDEDLPSDDEDLVEVEEAPKKKNKPRQANTARDDEEDSFPDKIMDAISPINEDGLDLWTAMKNHPTQYAEARLIAYHPESKREPLPFYPKNRANPHPVIVKFFSRWLFVTGLPPAMTEEGMKVGKASKLTALQEQDIQKTVTNLFGVSYGQVYPANETSAFIGFETPEQRDSVAKGGPSDKMLFRPLTLSAHTPSEADEKYEFIKTADPKTIVKLDSIPPYTYTKDTLARDLFPEGTELDAAYPVSRDAIAFLSPTTALIQMGSADQVEAALASETVAARLQELGRYPVRSYLARRNVVHERMEDENTEVRRQGYRLVVDGDMPSKKFYISHANVIMLRNLDYSSVSKESISELFAPFSDIPRDVNGSVEFVTCYSGLPTDRAYVGFERLGEAEAVMATFKGRARIGENVAYLKLVKDRKIPGAPERVSRPERSEDEILKSLNDWEQYVDTEDVKYLEEHGVAKVVIDETLRGLRYKNRSFGALDFAMRDEKLEQNKESGEDYRELVQMYIETLKECIATPENPGEWYGHMHFPDEPIDVSIFEKEKLRQKKLMKKREGLED